MSTDMQPQIVAALESIAETSKATLDALRRIETALVEVEKSIYTAGIGIESVMQAR